MVSYQRSSLKQPYSAFLDLCPFLRMDMLLSCLKFPRLNSDMNNNLLHPTIEDANQVTIPARPYIEPSMREKKDDVIRDIVTALMKPLR